MKAFIGGVFAAIGAMTIMAACQTAPKFSYKFYALNALQYDGTLMGPKPAQDHNLKECVPSNADKAPCVVMFTPEFKAMKLDYLDLQNRLMKCEAQ